jgi:hypothetical protein
MTNYSFPTLGQTLRFAVDVLGVLPRKRGDKNELNEADKKRLQKKLHRLANEEGSLADNLDAVINEISQILGHTLKSDNIHSVLHETMLDLYQVYNGTIRDEGTYLPEHETIQWFCTVHAIPRLALSLQKHLLRTGLIEQGKDYPGYQYWYLPSVENSRISWPLANVMTWVYQLFSTSQERFHYPNRNQDANHQEQRQNLENARKWSQGRNLPSWETLRWTFSRAFEELSLRHIGLGDSELKLLHKESIYVALFVARFSTDLCMRIEKSYGLPFLEECIDQFKDHHNWLSHEVKRCRFIANENIEKNGKTLLSPDEIWLGVSEGFIDSIRDGMTFFASTIQQIMISGGQIQRLHAVETELIRQYGEYPVKALLSYASKQSLMQEKVPKNFFEFWGKGLQLKKTATTDIDVDEYEKSLIKHQLMQNMGWVVPWLRAIVRYRKQEFKEALHFAEQALSQAKYSAGVKQYNLVNLYVHLAAKNNDRRRFKKGIEWAKFTGVEIRLLRESPPTQENLDSVFEMLRKIEYSQL